MWKSRTEPFAAGSLFFIACIEQNDNELLALETARGPSCHMGVSDIGDVPILREVFDKEHDAWCHDAITFRGSNLTNPFPITKRPPNTKN